MDRVKGETAYSLYSGSTGVRHFSLRLQPLPVTICDGRQAESALVCGDPKFLPLPNIDLINQGQRLMVNG